jgi:hypothetical protein
MALIDLQLRLDAYKKCELAILNGAQKYEVEDKMFQRADLGLVQKLVKSLEQEIAALTPKKKRMRQQNITFRRV